MRAVGVQVEQKLGCVFADAQIAHGLAVFGVEMLADGGISDVVFVVVLFQAVGNNSCKQMRRDKRAAMKSQEHNPS